MKNNKIKKLGTILKIFLKLCLLVGILLLLTLYNIVNSLGLKFDLFILLIYPCGICFLLLIYQFIGLFTFLEKNNPFSEATTTRLNNSMILSFVISLLILVALLLTIFTYSYYTLQFKVSLAFIMILFFGVGIALYILKALFKIATNYKEENELTI